MAADASATLAPASGPPLATASRTPWARWSSSSWRAAVLFLVALVVGVAAPLAAIAGLDPINALDTPAVAWTGVAIGAVGVLLTLAAQLSMGAQCTARRTSAIERASVVSFRGSVGRL